MSERIRSESGEVGEDLSSESFVHFDDVDVGARKIVFGEEFRYRVGRSEKHFFERIDGRKHKVFDVGFRFEVEFFGSLF